MSASRPYGLSPATVRQVRWISILAAVIGTAIGLNTLVLHLTTDPLADVHAYYDAGARLNAGLPLYDQDLSDSVGLYLYPPLIAILFRPLAVLPFEQAALIWEAVMVAAFLGTLWRIDARRRPVMLALGMLAMPILWTLSIGQAESAITLLLAIGAPWSVALAGHMKLVPLLVAVIWVGRRDWRKLAKLATWFAALSGVQLLLEPAGTLAYLRLEWLQPAFAVRNISPFAIHPLLWLATVGVLGIAALAAARTRWGWPFAVALAVFAYPRLLAYQLSSLLAVFGGPRDDHTAH